MCRIKFQEFFLFLLAPITILKKSYLKTFFEKNVSFFKFCNSLFSIAFRNRVRGAAPGLHALVGAGDRARPPPQLPGRRRHHLRHADLPHPRPHLRRQGHHPRAQLHHPRRHLLRLPAHRAPGHAVS